MSTSLNRIGGLEPPTTTILPDTSANTVFTGGKYIQTIEAIVLANVDTTTACRVTLRWVDATPTAHIFWNGVIAADSTHVVDYIPLIAGVKYKVRSITAQAQAANDISVTVITSAQTPETPKAPMGMQMGKPA